MSARLEERRVKPELERAGAVRSDSRLVFASIIFAAVPMIEITALGANGALLAAILDSNPHARGTLLECAEGIRGARGNAAVTALGDRVELLTGDFFQAVPAGADTYVLKHVLHDWDDERAAHILRNCRAAMGTGGRLLIVEVMYEEGDLSSRGKLLDLSMLLMTGGRERSEREYRALCAGAGLTIARVLPKVGRFSLIEAECA